MSGGAAGVAAPTTRGAATIGAATMGAATMGAGVAIFAPPAGANALPSLTRSPGPGCRMAKLALVALTGAAWVAALAADGCETGASWFVGAAALAVVAAVLSGAG